MIICYAKTSAPSAKLIAEQSSDIVAKRCSDGDVNWGRSKANTKLNPDITMATNKHLMRYAFKKHNVPTPELYTYETLKYPCIGRPDKHSMGRGFWKCNNLEEVAMAIKGTKRKKGATHFMEYIDAPREYRVHIFKGKSIRISEKDHTEFHVYTTIRPTGNVNHVRDVAKRAVKALGLDFGAVDILANDKQAWALEVNTAPGIGGSMPRVYATKFKEWFEEEK